MPVRVLRPGGGTALALADGFDYAADMGADVVNASLTGSGSAQIVADAVAAHPDTLFVVAAGNDNKDIDSAGNTVYPCNIDASNLICVAATTQSDEPRDLLQLRRHLGRPGARRARPSARRSPPSPTCRAAPTASRRRPTPRPSRAIGRRLAGRAHRYQLGGQLVGDRLRRGRLRGERERHAQEGPALRPHRPRRLLRSFQDAPAHPGGRGLPARGELRRRQQLGPAGRATPATRGRASPPTRSFSARDGGLAHLRFRFTSDASVNSDGVHLDAVRVSCATGYSSSSYGYFNGTSMASPHVAGAAALVKSLRPGASVAELRADLLEGGDALAGLSGITTSGRRLNARGALEHDGPQAVTSDPASVGMEGATLAGEVNPVGRATQYHFEYGTDETYGSETAPQDAGSGPTPTPVTESVTGLQAGTTYHYRLVATRDGIERAGEDKTLTTNVDPSLPAQATGLTADPGPREVGLDWDDTAMATGYEVFSRAESEPGYPVSPEATPSTSEHVSSSLTAGARRCFKVRAVNHDGAGPFSDEVCATPEGDAPGAVANLTADALVRSARLSWTAASGADAYVIHRRTASGTYPVLPYRMVSATTFTDTGLPAGSPFCYRVQAVNQWGTGGLSPERCVTPTAPPVTPPESPPPPGAPACLAARGPRAGRPRAVQPHAARRPDRAVHVLLPRDAGPERAGVFRHRPPRPAHAPLAPAHREARLAQLPRLDGGTVRVKIRLGRKCRALLAQPQAPAGEGHRQRRRPAPDAHLRAEGAPQITSGGAPAAPPGRSLAVLSRPRGAGARALARARRVQESVRRREGAEPFVFYEGPPTANGRPGAHHVLARVFKDVFPRFQAMRGRQVHRKAGWDCHGLPVELQVEQELGLHREGRTSSATAWPSSTPSAASRCSSTSTSGTSSPSGSGSGSTPTTPTSPSTTPTSSRSGGRSSRCGTRACSTRATRWCPTARVTARRCPRTRWPWGTRTWSIPPSTCAFP